MKDYSQPSSSFPLLHPLVVTAKFNSKFNTSDKPLISLLLDCNGSHAHTLVKKAVLQPSGFTGSIHQESTSQHAHGKTSILLSLQFHTRYYCFMYNYIQLAQIKG